MSANTRIVGAAKSGLALQKAFLAIIVVVLVMAVANLFPETRNNFFTEANFINVLKSASIFIILAMGETIVLIAGGVDLSIGGMMAFSGVVVILLMNAGVPIPDRHRPRPPRRRRRSGRSTRSSPSTSERSRSSSPSAWASC